MNLKKRLLLLLCTPVIIVPFLYLNRRSPTKISGPTYVEGWYRNTSKRISDYVSDTLAPLILPKNFCAEKGILLVIVQIRPENFKARNAIRETWGQKRDNVSFYFLVGEDKSYNYEVQLNIKDEDARFNDIIQERFIDSYNNLTLKSVNMLKLFNRYCSKSYKYLMKIDDDVFLNTNNLLKMLKNRLSSTNLLVGKVVSDTKPFRDPTNKWYVPYELYAQEKYPDYLCGPSYVMSSDVVEKLYRSALETPIFYIEDVYVTGVCAEKANLTVQHNSMFTCNIINKYICLHRNIYTVHYYKPEEIRESYKILEENRCPAHGSLTEWIFSLI